MTDYTIFMHLRATADWLALPPDRRFAFMAEDVAPRLQAHPAVRMRYFDAEAFSSRVSDIVMLETADLDQYMALVESLRESPFWGRYFEVGEILPAVEDAYARHYGVYNRLY